MNIYIYLIIIFTLLLNFNSNVLWYFISDNPNLDYTIPEWSDKIDWYKYNGSSRLIKNYPVDNYLCKNVELVFSKYNDILNNSEKYSIYTSYSNYSESPSHATWILDWNNWKKYEIGIWWSSWWYSFNRYCYKKWYFNSYSDHNFFNYTGCHWCSVTINLNKENWSYNWELLWKIDNDYISIKWSQNISEKNITSPTFNSPFIYFKNQPIWDIKIWINSEWSNYTSMKPNFNIKNWWNLKSNWNEITVDNKKINNLFYELDVKKIEITRNWQNFSSKNELIDFLKNWDFFEKMWFSKDQKDNSLNYILPKIKDSNNYYLTILDNKSINNISELDINPSPKNIIRKYFTIYPTKLPVKTNGDLVYPKTKITDWYTVEENWEFYISDDMFVLWK